MHSSLSSPRGASSWRRSVPIARMALALVAGGFFVGGCGAEVSLEPPTGSDAGPANGLEPAPVQTPAPLTEYPSGMVAAYGPGGAGVSFFSYDTATGFVPLGGLASGSWQSVACGQITFDAHRNLYLTCTGYGSGVLSGRVLEFASGARDGSEPIRVITGPSLGASLLIGSAVDSKGNVYVVANNGMDGGAVVVFGPGSDSTPIHTIQGADTQLFYPNNIAVDASDDVYVGTDAVPVVEFAPGADGDAVPIQLIGNQAGCGGTEGVALDSTGRIYIDAVLQSSYVPDGGFPPDSIVVFANGAIERTISGPTTRMNEILTTAVDGAGRIYVGNYDGTDGSTGVYVFGAGASGDVAPEATLSTVSGLAVAVAP
jgi:hypothetical protein